MKESLAERAKDNFEGKINLSGISWSVSAGLQNRLCRSKPASKRFISLRLADSPCGRGWSSPAVQNVLIPKVSYSLTSLGLQFFQSHSKGLLREKGRPNTGVFLDSPEKEIPEFLTPKRYILTESTERTHFLVSLSVKLPNLSVFKKNTLSELQVSKPPKTPLKERYCRAFQIILFAHYCLHQNLLFFDRVCVPHNREIPKKNIIKGRKITNS